MGDFSKSRCQSWYAVKVFNQQSHTYFGNMERIRVPIQNAQSTSLIQSPGRPERFQTAPFGRRKWADNNLFQNVLTRAWNGLEAITRRCSDGRSGARFWTIISLISTGMLSSGGMLREEYMMFQVTLMRRPWLIDSEAGEGAQISQNRTIGASLHCCLV